MSFLPTKGIEYILILSYLALLIPFWWMIRRRATGATVRLEARAPRPRVTGRGSWFEVPEGHYFHRGHSWVRPEGPTMTVGMDDFAYGLVGRPDALLLPEPGTHLVQGEKGWSARIDGHLFELLSPLDGEVVEVNTTVADQPAVANADPYRRGWLLKVRPDHGVAAIRNLLPHDVARAWMDDVQRSLSRRMGLSTETVMQSGGLPVSGFARQIGGDHWHELAEEFLLTREPRRPAEPAPRPQP